MFYPPPKPAKAEAPGTGKGILGGLLGLGLLALGVALIAATFYDIWQVSSLRDRGVQVQANVAIEGFGTEHQRVGLSDYSIPVINYSYSFEVQGNTYRGSASDSDPDFTGARQQEKAKGRSDQPSPPRVGSVLVTYLPENPSRHRFGRVDQTHVAAAYRKLWLGIPGGALFILVGGVVVLGCYFTIRDQASGRKAAPA